MKGSVTLGILSMLAETVVEASVVFETILLAPYGSSIGKLQAVERFVRLGRMQAKQKREQGNRSYNLLYKLKRDGLIEERSRSGKIVLGLTRRGATKLAELKKRSESRYPAPTYNGQESDRFTIVAFDIPETERKKRAWLRSALQRLELRMVQQSLWMGKRRIPAEFIRDLGNLRLIEYVEIFEITKAGSLRHVA